MRFRSRQLASGRAYAVSGTNTISFALQASAAGAAGLLGYAVERVDTAKSERYFMAGFKVFSSVIAHPTPQLAVSTFDQPVQSFMWDDFTAEPDHEYTYVFHPLKGTPKNLDRTARPITIKVRTEPLITGGHDVYFNRGVASSQAYERDFGLQPIAALVPAVQQKALAWLSRDLGTSMLRFIDDCGAGDGLRCCFYEFRYQPIADALAKAIKRGVDVQLIVDAKDNGYTDKKGVVHPSFPKEDNLATIKAAKLPASRVRLRVNRASDIAHNKFMVRLPGGGVPTEVWTGSTNVSLGAIAGQTNVGHWVRDATVAAQYQAYWTLLHGDPGSVKTDPLAQRKQADTAFEAAVEALSPVPSDLHALTAGTIAGFSPRHDTSLLTSYAQLLDTAVAEGCVTLAFGVSAEFKALLKDNTSQSAIVFMLLEKKDAPVPKSKTAFVWINSRNNVYKAWGSYIRNPVYQWAKETNAGLLGLNQHVSYVHSKFMLVDPLGDDPITVTGSANFSDASVADNDENMLLVRGDKRVADIYFTEFNRLFNHYYFRSVTEATTAKGAPPDTDSLFLTEDSSWQAKYAPGKLKAKRLGLYVNMKGAVTL
jgi:phosphatidylserine/phosphatidylglycerophosphate/cardiolipin synthase-like enzyme